MGNHHRYILCFILLDEFRLGCGSIVDSLECVYKRVDPIVVFMEFPLLPIEQVEFCRRHESNVNNKEHTIADALSLTWSAFVLDPIDLGVIASMFGLLVLSLLGFLCWYWFGHHDQKTQVWKKERRRKSLGKTLFFFSFLLLDWLFPVYTLWMKLQCK